MNTTSRSLPFKGKFNNNIPVQQLYGRRKITQLNVRKCSKLKLELRLFSKWNVWCPCSFRLHGWERLCYLNRHIMLRWILDHLGVSVIVCFTISWICIRCIQCVKANAITLFRKFNKRPTLTSVVHCSYIGQQGCDLLLITHVVDGKESFICQRFKSIPDTNIVTTRDKIEICLRTDDRQW